MRSVSSHPDELALSECLGLLAQQDIGRLCIVDDGFPAAFPVNYRLVPDGSGGAVIVLRTRPGGVLDAPETKVGFEVDGIDRATETGWSVLVRGTLHAVTEQSPEWLRAWDPRPWAADRTSWLYVEPVTISGRRLSGSTITWAFAIGGYL